MRRNYWVYSAGLLVAWGVVLLVVPVLRRQSAEREVLPVFEGFCIGWVTTTIARYVYPPPRRWTPQPPRL
jgi:hypothetical protein